MNPDKLLIYHGGCFDGFTAAWLFHKAFPEAPTVGARYGEPLPEAVDDAEVWVVDFSYPEALMFELCGRAARVVWLDHHLTAKAYADRIAPHCGTCIFDMERCGSMILLDHLAKDPPIGELWLHWSELRWLVEYVQDRDLWRLELPNTREVSAWIAAQPMTFEAWDELAANGRAAAIAHGGAVQRYIDQYGRKARAEARYEWLDGHRVPTINLPYMNCSEHVGKLLEENPDAPFAAGYFRRADGRWQFSLRGRDAGPSVAQVAEAYGGGGHRNAAGFEITDLPWDDPQ